MPPRKDGRPRMSSWTQARHLVARAAQRALGALEREHRLARDELGEARRLREIGAAGAAPALAQLGDRSPARPRRCGSDRAPGAGSAAGAALRDRADRAAGSDRAAARCAGRRASWAARPRAAARAAPRRRTRGRPRARAASVACADAATAGGAPRRSRARPDVGRPTAFDPGAQQALLERARGVEQEHRTAAVDERPAGLDAQRGEACRWPGPCADSITARWRPGASHGIVAPRDSPRRPSPANPRSAECPPTSAGPARPGSRCSPASSGSGARPRTAFRDSCSRCCPAVCCSAPASRCC